MTTTATAPDGRSTGRRYPAAVMHRARELRAAGWTYEQIRNILEQETGHRPARSMVARWVDERQAQRFRDRQNAWLAERRANHATFTLAGRRPADGFTADYQAAFVRRMSEIGLSPEAVAKVAVELVDPDWTRTAVETLLAGGVPHHLRRKQAA